MASPIEKLSRFKRQAAKEQPARVDVMAILHASDPSLRENAPPTRKELFDRHRRAAEPSLEAATGHLDFFSRLGVEAEVDRSLNCPPGSVLPSVASPQFLRRGVAPTSVNLSFRSVGYESPPVQPYARQSKTIYQSQLAAKETKERRGQARPRRGRRSPSANVSTTLDQRQRSRRKSKVDSFEPFYQGILELHEKAVERAKREHANGRGSSSAVLYNRAKQRSKKERRRKQVERWCSDADASVAAVV